MNNNDFRITKIAPQYKAAVDESFLNLDHYLNSQIKSYEEKIISLKKLITSGDISPDISAIINKSLLDNLKPLRSSQNSKFEQVPFIIKLMSSSEAQVLNEDLKNLFKENRGQESQFFKQVEDKILSIFIRENTDGDYEPDARSLIQINRHKNSQGHDFNLTDMNYGALVENYLENYIKILKGDDNLAWNQVILNEYLKYLENKVYWIGTDFEIKVRDVIKENIAFELLVLAKGDDSDYSIEMIHQNIDVLTNKLIESQQRNFSSIETHYKLAMIQASNILFNQLNFDGFSEAVKLYIEDKKSKDQEVIQYLLDQVNELIYSMKEIETDLLAQGLKNFIFFPPLVSSIESAPLLLNLMDSLDLFRSNTSEESSSLQIFMNERNEYGQIIEAKLDLEDGDYALLIKDIKSQNFNEQSKNPINLLLLNCLESLAENLKHNYMKALANEWSSLIFGSNRKDYNEIYKQLLTRGNEVNEKIKTIIKDYILDLQIAVINDLSSAVCDDLVSILSEQSLKAHIDQWFIDNKTNKSWQTMTFWTPPEGDLSQLVNRLFKETIENFIKKYNLASELKIQEKYNTLLTQNSVMNLVVKAGTIGLDSLKLLAIIKTGGALLPFLVDAKDDSIKLFTTQLSQAMSELRDEISQKEKDEQLKILQGKAKDGGVEVFKSTLELYKSSPDLTLSKIGKKLNERYNLFDNESEIKAKLLTEITKLRNEQSRLLDNEIKESIRNKTQHIRDLSKSWGIDSAVEEILKS